jgi:hypothetical protein
MKKITTGVEFLLLSLVAASASLRAAESDTTAVTQAGYLLVLRVTTDGTVHRIVDSMLVASPVALTPAPPVADGHSLNYAVADSEGRLVFEAGMPNPQEWRSPLPPPGQPEKGHERVVLPQVEYVIRMPYDKAAATLQIAVGVKPGLAAASRNRSSAPVPGTQSFSLQPWVRAAEVKADQR